MIAELVVVDVGRPAVIETYAAMRAFMVKNGHGIGDNDVWIAATAAAADATLLTADRDFDPLDGRFLRRIYFDPKVV